CVPSASRVRAPAAHRVSRARLEPLLPPAHATRSHCGPNFPGAYNKGYRHDCEIYLLTVAFLIGLVTLSAHAQQGPTQAELNAAASNAVDWVLTNHDYGGQRFVDATEITRDSAGSLRAVCVYQARGLRPVPTKPPRLP